MGDPRREGEGSRNARTTPATEQEGAGPSARPPSGTAGTDRDFDEQQESKNQGHGHPREERGTGS